MHTVSYVALHTAAIIYTLTKIYKHNILFTLYTKVKDHHLPEKEPLPEPLPLPELLVLPVRSMYVCVHCTI